MPASLTERLGYKKNDRLLIVNCDDLGASASANRATAHVMAEGVATSATLMVPCAWALDAVKMGVNGGVGVHLTFTAEYPGYRWRTLTGAASLHDNEGYMPAESQTVWAKADLPAVREECRAQIDQAYAWGVDVTHLDAHMGAIMGEPRFFEIFLDMARDYDLPVRMFEARYEKKLGFPARKLAAAEGLVFPDYIQTTWGRPSRRTFADILEGLRPGVTEVYLHPVEDGPELRGYDPTHPQIRVDEYECLKDPAWKEHLVTLGVHLIDFTPLRDLQRAQRKWQQSGGTAPTILRRSTTSA